MAEPSGQMQGAAGRGNLRASHADREDAIGTLKAAFVQGRLAKDEFDLRVGQVLVSRTYAELAAVTADLPAGPGSAGVLIAAARPAKPAGARGKRTLLRGPGTAMILATVLYGGMWPLALALPTNSEGDPVDGVSLIMPATLVYILVIVLACLWAQARGSQARRQAIGP